MIEVTENLCDLIPYFSELLKYNYIIYSILDGNIKGKIFVDRFPEPTVIVAWDTTEDSGLYLEGKYSPEIAQEINQILISNIFPESEKYENCRDLTSCFDPLDEWSDHIEDEVFNNIYVRLDKRKFFSFNVGINQVFDWKKQIPPHLSMISYDGIKKQAKLMMGDFDIMDIQDFDGFEKLSMTLKNAHDPFACCVIDIENKILISRVFTDWNSGKFVETGINTNEKYRKQGLGAACAIAMIELASSRGYNHIGWHCWAENEGSEKTALRAGFTLERTHPVFHAWYNRFDNLLLHLDHLIDNGDVINNYGIFMELEDEKRINSVSYQTSFFRKQEYYAGWYLYLKILNNGNSESSGKIDEAIQALEERMKLEITNPRNLVKILREKITNKKIWENQEWIKLIKVLESSSIL